MKVIIKSLLTLAWKILTLLGLKLPQWCKKGAVGIPVAFYASVVVPAFVMALGIGIGWLGYIFTVAWVIVAGKLLIASAALWLALGMTFIWLGFGALVEWLVTVSAAVKKIPIVTPNFPDVAASRTPVGTSVGFNMTNLVDVWSLNTGINQEMAKDILYKIMGVMAWLAVVGVYASVFSVYASPIGFLVVLAAGALLAFAVVGWRRKSKLGEHVAFYFGVAVILLVTLNFGQAIMRYRVDVAKLRQQALDAKRYEGLANVAMDLYEEYGAWIKLAPSFGKKISLAKVCAQCLKKKDCIESDCLEFAARAKYRYAQRQMEKLKSEMTPGTPGEIWAYAKKKTSETARDTGTLAKKVSAPVAAEMESLDKGDCKKASLWIYGALAILALVVLIISLCFLRDKRRWLKAVAAIVALAAFTGLSASGYGMLMHDTYCGLDAQPVAKSQAIKPAPSPAEPVASPAPKVQPGPTVKAPAVVIHELEDEPKPEKIGGLTKQELLETDSKLAALEKKLKAMDL